MPLQYLENCEYPGVVAIFSPSVCPREETVFTLSSQLLSRFAKLLLPLWAKL